MSEEREITLELREWATAWQGLQMLEGAGEGLEWDEFRHLRSVHRAVRPVAEDRIEQRGRVMAACGAETNGRGKPRRTGDGQAIFPDEDSEERANRELAALDDETETLSLRPLPLAYFEPADGEKVKVPGVLLALEDLGLVIEESDIGEDGVSEASEVEGEG